MEVAPFAGAWIEMSIEQAGLSEILSLPSRERGLKLAVKNVSRETKGRSLRGSVD